MNGMTGRRCWGFRLAAAALLPALLVSGCASTCIDSAKRLAPLGKEVSAKVVGNIFATDDEFQRAMDAEAFLNGLGGQKIPQQLLENELLIQSELTARKRVFDSLGEAYDAWAALASVNAAGDAQTALNDLGDAVNAYAKALGKGAVMSAPEKDAIARIGGWVASAVQKRKVVKSSALIRDCLREFAALLEDPRVRMQMTTFRATLVENRLAALQDLWNRRLIDPTPLIDQLGDEVGLKATKDAAKNINDVARSGLTQVVENRFARKAAAIERGYDVSVKTIKTLIAKHEKLERDGDVDLAELRQAVAELRQVNMLLVAETGKTATLE